MCAYQFTSTASSTARSSTSSPCGANSVVWGFKWPTVCDTLVWRRCNGARGSICKSSGGFSPPASNVADRAYFGACRPNLLEPNGEWDTRRVQSTVGVQWLQIKLDRNEWRPARLAGLQSLRSAHVDCIGAGVWPEKEGEGEGVAWVQGGRGSLLRDRRVVRERRLQGGSLGGSLLGAQTYAGRLRRNVANTHTQSHTHT